MIVFDLSCESGHRFEGWFGSSRDFADQQESGLIACPQCGSISVAKAPMAPAVGRKGGRDDPRQRPGSRRDLPAHDAGQARLDQADQANQPVAGGAMAPALAAAVAKLAEAQRKALRNSRWVGGDFAETSRAMHYGERGEEAIHGRASAQEARSLIEEGIRIAPLPFPVSPPDEVN